MAFYVKANHKVAEFLKVESIRLKLSDGNYLLWMEDMRSFGRLADIVRIAAQIGGVVLQPYEARQEVDGTQCRQLPAAEDERFYVEPESEPDTGLSDGTGNDNENSVGNPESGQIETGQSPSQEGGDA